MVTTNGVRQIAAGGERVVATRIVGVLFLVVLTDSHVAQDLALALRRRHCRVALAEEPRRALELAAAEAPDMVLLDRCYEGALVEPLFALHPKQRVAVLLASARETPTHHRVRTDGGVVYNIAPPLDADELIGKASTPDPDDFGAVASRAEHDKEYILRVFELTGRRVSKTALALKIARRTLQRLLAQWQVRAEDDDGRR
jgi:ActR/RegA family two-component response regulator